MIGARRAPTDRWVTRTCEQSYDRVQDPTALSFQRTSVQDRGFLAVMSTYPEYSLDTAIVEFFTQPSVTREVCDIKARDLAGQTKIDR